MGSIEYDIEFVPNPRYRGRGAELFSDELHTRIRRHNVPARRVVHFDGRKSRIDEINTDYEVLSPSIEFRSAEGDTVIFCKQLLNLGFCVEYPTQLAASDHPPVLEPSREKSTIAGITSRRADYIGARHLTVWYAEGVEVSDPTGAVLALPGVPGLVLRTQEVADSDRVDAVERVNVTKLSTDPPPAETFSIPNSYEMFESVDQARAEDRRLLDAKADEEIRRRPLGEAERQMFVGEWEMKTGKDRIRVTIRRRHGDEFTFRTVVDSAPPGLAGRETVEKGRMKDRMLVVESPPNYRVYRVADEGTSLVQERNDIFRFTRA